MKKSPNKLGKYRIYLSDPRYERESFLMEGLEEPILSQGYFWFGKAFIIDSSLVKAIVKGK